MVIQRQPVIQQMALIHCGNGLMRLDGRHLNVSSLVVDFLVRTQVTRSSKCLVALVAGIGTFPCVCSFVFFEVAVSKEHHGALVTGNVFFTNVYFYVFFQVANISKCLGTLVTAVRPLSSVDSSMIFKMPALTKCLWAYFTFVRFLSCMT